MVAAQQIEEQKHKKRYREAMTKNTGDGHFSHSRYARHVRSKILQRFSKNVSSNYETPYQKK